MKCSTSGMSFDEEIREKKIFFKLHAVGPRGERLHHAVGLAASVRGVRGGLPRVRLNLKLRISFKI